MQRRCRRRIRRAHQPVLHHGSPFWQAGEQILLGAQNATLAACYPYAPGRVNPVVVRSQRYDTGEDFHYVNFLANKDASAVTLDLARVYSRLVFNFKADTDYVGDGKVTVICLEGNGIVPVATLDMFDPAVSSPGNIRMSLFPSPGSVLPGSPASPRSSPRQLPVRRTA